MTERKFIKDLLDRIDDADENYYNNNNSIITDEEYDGLKDLLRMSSFVPKTKADQKLVNRISDALTRVGAPPPKDGKWPKG